MIEDKTYVYLYHKYSWINFGVSGQSWGNYYESLKRMTTSCKIWSKQVITSNWLSLISFFSASLIAEKDDLIAEV